MKARNEYVAIKIEKASAKHPLLSHEYDVYRNMVAGTGAGAGIPDMLRKWHTERERSANTTPFFEFMLEFIETEIRQARLCLKPPTIETTVKHAL